MNILIVSQYFWPEPFIINELVLKIKGQGHQVTIFTGKPNYPDGDIYPGYTSAGLQEEIYHSDISIFRVPLRPRKNGNAKNLTLNYLSFVFSGLKHAFSFAKNKRFDAILVLSLSPVTAVLPAIMLKWLTKSHLTIWVQDLWPESISATGFVNNRFILGCVRSLVRAAYYFSDTILVQSQAFIKPVSRLAPKKEVIYYPNSEVDHFSGHPSSSRELPSELISVLESQFCVVFAGNIGTAQAVETIVGAAEKLKDIPDLKLVLVGSGTKSSWIKQQLIDKKLSNLLLPGRFPPSDMPFIFSKASALLVTLKADEIFTYTIPTKIQSYLAAGKPIFASLDGEGANVIKASRAGLTSPAEDAEALAINIKTLYDLSPSKREEFGKAGRAYFLEHFEMESQSKRLIKIIEEGISKKNRRESK